MSSIGTLDFAVMQARSPLAPQGMVLDVVERAGTHGRDYRQVGRKPVPAVYETMQGYTSDNDQRSAKDDYLALQGTVTTLEDGLGNEWDVVVVSVAITREGKAIKTAGLGGDYFLGAIWTVEPLE